MFFLFLFTLLQLQTFETDNGFYILIQSEREDLTFSSYRLNNPERIVLEINGSVPAKTVNSAQTVKSVKISEQGGITRFIFETENNTHYTVLNKSNAVLIGFSLKLFLDEGNFDTTLAKVKTSLKPEEKIIATQKENPVREKKVAVNTQKPDESKLVGNFLEDLKEKEIKEQLARKKETEKKRLAELKRQEELKKLELEREKAEEKRRMEEEKRIAELKKQEELKRREIAKKRAEEKRLAELKHQEELKRIEQEKKETEKRHLAELKRQEELRKIQIEKKKAEEKRLAELKRQEELKKQEIARKKAEEKRIAELKKQEELKRIEQEKKAAQERKLAELKRQEELKRIELERKEAEKKRLAELKRREEEKKRLAELKRQEELKKQKIAKKEAEEKRLAEIKRQEKLKRIETEKKKAEEKRLAELKLQEELKRKEEEEKRLAVVEKKKKEKKKLIKTEEGNIRNLKVTKAAGEKSLSEERPDLPVKKLVRKGTLKNIYFRKFVDFSRVTLEISGDTEYKFREIKGGYVIDVHNFKKIPRHLLNIIDARAFKAQVKYIYPKKVDNILKIYIKTDKGIAVRKSKEGDIINFDFFEPTLK